MRSTAHLGGSDPYAWLRAARSALIHYTWGSAALPSTLPTVTRDYTGPSYRTDYALGGVHCSGVDRYLCPVLGGWNAEAHRLKPPTRVVRQNKLMVFQGGHVSYWDTAPGEGGDNTNEVGVINTFLEAGWDVLAVSMPLWQYNINPLTITFPDLTTHVFADHDFGSAEAAGMRTMRFFLDGGIVALNQAILDLHPAAVVGAGISGGGDTLDKWGAVDPRLQRIYPCCGSMPFYLLQSAGGPGADGDFELQIGRPWWSVIGSRSGWDPREILYAMSCFDAGRKHLKTLVDTDTVFPAATVHTELATMAARVAGAVPAGQFALNIDPSPATAGFHTIPPATCALILSDAQSL